MAKETGNERKSFVATNVGELYTVAARCGVDGRYLRNHGRWQEWLSSQRGEAGRTFKFVSECYDENNNKYNLLWQSLRVLEQDAKNRREFLEYALDAEGSGMVTGRVDDIKKAMREIDKGFKTQGMNKTLRY